MAEGEGVTEAVCVLTGVKEIILVIEGVGKAVYVGSWVIVGKELQPALKSTSRNTIRMRGLNIFLRNIIHHTPYPSRQTSSLW